jgi:hypothetical protein
VKRPSTHRPPAAVDDRRNDRREAEEEDAARIARLRRDRALTPAERLNKLAALCRQADVLRGARRLP